VTPAAGVADSEPGGLLTQGCCAWNRASPDSSAGPFQPCRLGLGVCVGLPASLGVPPYPCPCPV